MRTFGTLRHGTNGSKEVWQLDLEPHVAVKVKRLFPRANQSHAGIVLGVKRRQADPIVDPDAPLVTAAVDTSDRIRRLAADVLGAS